MDYQCKPLAKRKSDWQYQDRLKQIRKTGELATGLPQDVPALTCFGTLSPMIFDLSNGVPLITERSIAGSWKYALGEIIAFINGARTIDEIESYGCGPKFWGPYRGMGTELGLDPDDMGPASYGGMFGAYSTPDGPINQFRHVLEQIRNYPHHRTHLISPWDVYRAGRGPQRGVLVAPCHGWLHFRVLSGKLHMEMKQRSGDFPIGVPHNMIQYAALHLMVCQVVGYLPGNFIHAFSDAHIYENQVKKVDELIARSPRPFPILKIDPGVKDLFAFRINHFEIEEYNPHPSMSIEFSK